MAQLLMPALSGIRAATALHAALVGLCVFACFNANGREIVTSDSQAAKFAAVNLVRHRSLTLDGVIGRTPLYAERLAFQRDVEGHWRNAYPLPPVLEAAAVGTVLRRTGLLDLRATLAPSVVAKMTASLVASIATALAFVIARRYARPLPALLVALGFALGTGMWPIASQTLWQHATVVCSTMTALALWLRWPGRDAVVRFAVIAALLGWGMSARPQVTPMIGILALAILVRGSARERVGFLIAFAAPVAIFAWLNLRWFGHPLGMKAQFEQVSLAVHGTQSTWQWPGPGLLGLLFSPNRGFLIFTPAAAVIIAARPAPQDRATIAWLVAAAGTQILVYASFSVWWAGHTYGPRYLLDALPPLVPLAALGADRVASARIGWRAIAVAALAWSITTAATGAFCYPQDQWNTDPVSVNRDHSRLWDVRDNQIVRCWRAGLSAQNFALFDRAAWRRTEPY